MEDRKFILDKGLFLGRADFKFKVPDSIDTIINLHKTIKEYREYSDPSSPTWINYVQEFYHLMGFHTEYYNQRIMILRGLGDVVNSPPAILLGISLPQESIDKIVPWLNWTSLLSITASTLNIGWGILTNGFEFKIVNFGNKDFENIYFWANLEKIIKEGSDDSFLTIYKVFYHLRFRIETSSTYYKNVDNRTNISDYSGDTPKASRSYSDLVVSDDRFYQLPPTLQRIAQVYEEMIKNGLGFDDACEKIAQQNSISLQTVRQDCSAKIHLKADAFCKLVVHKEKFISHLQMCFPKETITHLF